MRNDAGPKAMATNTSSLGQGYALGEKEKKIDEQSEPSGSLGREKVRVRVFPHQPTVQVTSLTEKYFSYFTLFFCLFSTIEPDPRLTCQAMCTRIWIFWNRIFLSGFVWTVP